MHFIKLDDGRMINLDNVQYIADTGLDDTEIAFEDGSFVVDVPFEQVESLILTWQRRLAR